MNSQVFLLFNIAIAVIFIVLFLYRRGVARPSRLSMRDKGENKTNSKVPVMSSEARSAGFDPGAQFRELNVKFLYNGHDWDAYEVLGVPAGSSLEVAQKAYDQMASVAEDESREFLKAALQAIKMSK